MIVRRPFLYLAVLGMGVAFAANAHPILWDYRPARFALSVIHGILAGCLAGPLAITQWRLRVAEEFERIRKEMDEKMLRELSQMHNDYMAEVRTIARDGGA